MRADDLGVVFDCFAFVLNLYPMYFYVLGTHLHISLKFKTG